MRIVIDTNVVVSAFLTNGSSQQLIEHVMRDQAITWLMSSKIRSEYHSVLLRPKLRQDPAEVEQWLDLLDSVSIEIPVDVKISFPRDPKDAMFLALAEAGDAHYLITGDRDFTEAQTLIKTPIVAPHDFNAMYGI